MATSTTREQPRGLRTSLNVVRLAAACAVGGARGSRSLCGRRGGAYACCTSRFTLSPLQEQVGRSVAALPEADGFALAGGAALVVTRVVDRTTRDLDFFGPSAEDVDRLVPAVESALAVAGLTVRRERSSRGFARRTVLLGDEPHRARSCRRCSHPTGRNLVGNALCHNEEEDGHVEVVTGTRSGRAGLSVANSGPVVPAADVEQLFQPFERLGANRRCRAGGLGLGLSIVQAIADAHSATIDVRPQFEGGLHIDLSFPRGRHFGG